MTSAQKDIIMKLRHRNKGYSEIATQLGVSVNTVKSYCYRSGLSTTQLKETAFFCQNCGRAITEPSKTRPRKFCCTKCKQAWWNKHRLERKSSKICVFVCTSCGRRFYDYTHSNRKYCSLACYQKRGMPNDT